MKFDSKSPLFEIIYLRKTHQETILSHSHWLYPQEGRSRFLLKNPKNMNHNYDVINLCFDETRQKVFAQHHSELGEKTWFWVNILFTLIKVRSFFTLVVTELYQKVRKLPVSQNFPRKTTPEVLVECHQFFDESTESWVTERFFIFILFINWWVTWYGQKYFHISYCHNVAERNQR